MRLYTAQMSDDRVGLLVLNLKRFCENVVEGVEQWLSDLKDSGQDEAVLATFIRRHENGYPPFLKTPVIG